MTSRNAFRVVSAGALLGLTAAVWGCGKKQEPPPPPPPPPPMARAPEPVRVAEIITDPRVQFPQKFAPVNESLARAVVAFASDLAAGDVEGFQSVLDAPARSTLDLLVEGGEWTRATASIQAVRVVRLDASDTGADLGLAIQDGNGAYLTGWRIVRSGEQWVFGAIATPAVSALTAEELDGAALVAAVVEQPKAPAAPTLTQPDQPAERRNEPAFIN
ncbi:MAG: hypothetical protein IBJ10_04930 [Phycisphaerales bacterium]|nr:hypothetical protein [Phycisphaerales bacterium]